MVIQNNPMLPIINFPNLAVADVLAINDNNELMDVSFDALEFLVGQFFNRAANIDAGVIDQQVDGFKFA